MTAEFFAKIKPQPFQSFNAIEKERIEEIKLARLTAAGKLPPEPEPEWTREPFEE